MATLPSGIVINFVYDEGCAEGDMTAWTVIEPVKAVPEVPPPVWDDRPIDGARCMAATRAMCG
jgi:hypothetical protein